MSAPAHHGGQVDRRSSLKLGPIVLSVVAIAILYLFVRQQGPLTPHVSQLVTVGAGLMWFGWLCVKGDHGIFEPFGFLFTYVTLTVVLTATVAVTVGFSQGFLPASLMTPHLVLVQLLFLAGLFVGLAPTIRMAKPEPLRRVPETYYRPELVPWAWVVIAVALGFRVYQLVTRGAASWNLARAAEQNIESQFNVIASIGPLIAMALFIAARRESTKTVIGVRPLMVFIIWTGVSLALGTRDEVVGPLLMLGWAYHHRVKKLPGVIVVAAVAVGFMILSAIGSWRSGGTLQGVGNVVRPIASGTNTTALTVANLPGAEGFLLGETYLSSIPLLLPFGAQSSGDPSSLPAASRFPLEINYAAASGLGYSPIGEAYWNFGLTGTFVVPAIFGLCVVWSFRLADPWVHSPVGLLYITIVARTPIAVRSDFLQAAKGVLLVLVALMLVMTVFGASRERRKQLR